MTSVKWLLVRAVKSWSQFFGLYLSKVFTVDNSVMMGDMIRKVAFKIVVRSPVVGVYRASRLETPLQNR